MLALKIVGYCRRSAMLALVSYKDELPSDPSILSIGRLVLRNSRLYCMMPAVAMVSRLATFPLMRMSMSLGWLRNLCLPFFGLNLLDSNSAVLSF